MPWVDDSKRDDVALAWISLRDGMLVLPNTFPDAALDENVA